MKESTLIQMKNKLEQMDQYLGVMFMEIRRLQERQAQIGGIMSLMEGHDEAVRKFAEQIQEANEKAKAAQNEANEGGVDGLNEDATTSSKQETLQSQEKTSKEGGLDLELD